MLSEGRRPGSRGPKLDLKGSGIWNSKLGLMNVDKNHSESRNNQNKIKDRIPNPKFTLHSGGGIAIDYKIENVVAKADTRTKINLRELAGQFDNIEYEPARFPGLIMHLNDLSGALIFFQNGKIILTGMQDVEVVSRILKSVIQKLKDRGFEFLQQPEVDIQNIVASSELHKILNLNAIAITLGQENVEYNPEKFEGLLYRVGNTSIETVVFKSGKIICTGAKSLDEVEVALNHLLSDLESTGLMS
jgi:transcription initiation factor TFIID TATA-box-binding protein